jgi:hypothetical protein
MRTATSCPRLISESAQRFGRRATPIFISTARLIASRLGSAIWMLIGACFCSNARSTRSRAGDGSLCAITVSRPNSAIVTWRFPANGCRGCTSITSSSGPSVSEARPRSAGWNVMTPKSRLPCDTSTPTCREGTRRTSTWICGCTERNRATSGSRACTAASFAPMSTRPRRRSRSSRTAVSASSESRMSRCA